MFSGKHFFPFSASQSTNAKTGEFMRSFFILIVSGFIAFAHFLVFSIQLAVIICAVLSLIAVWLVFGSLRQMSWDKINQAYAEE
jgi:membrane protein implicated in regulation of membrane protease activity